MHWLTAPLGQEVWSNFTLWLCRRGEPGSPPSLRGPIESPAVGTVQQTLPRDFPIAAHDDSGWNVCLEDRKIPVLSQA